MGSLLIGTTAAKTLSLIYNKPLIPVNHMAGHIYANFLEDKSPEFPLVALVISGGHSEYIYMDAHLNFKYLGRTLDDAVGECYDKVARVVGLGYPGGPIIDKLAKNYQFKDDIYDLPMPLNDGSLNFSFSGLKSAAINLKNKEKELDKEKFAYSFQKVIVDTMVNKTKTLFDKYNIKSFIVAGGVSANSGIRDALKDLASDYKIDFYVPDLIYCTDNAAMIGSVAYQLYKRGQFGDLNTKTLANCEF